MRITKEEYLAQLKEDLALAQERFNRELATHNEAKVEMEYWQEQVNALSLVIQQV